MDCFVVDNLEADSGLGDGSGVTIMLAKKKKNVYCGSDGANALALGHDGRLPLPWASRLEVLSMENVSFDVGDILVKQLFRIL